MMDFYLPLFIMLALAGGLCLIAHLWANWHDLEPSEPASGVASQDGGAEVDPTPSGFVSPSFGRAALLFLLLDFSLVLLYPWVTVYRDLGWSAWLAVVGWASTVWLVLNYFGRKGELS